jgi:hypothetical protein
MEVQEVLLAEGLDRGLHPPDGRVLSAELSQACARMDRINGKCTTEAERLLWQVMRVSHILVDLGMLPIKDIPQLSKSAREVLPAVGLILKRLQEALASSAGPWD